MKSPILIGLLIAAVMVAPALVHADGDVEPVDVQRLSREPVGDFFPLDDDEAFVGAVQEGHGVGTAGHRQHERGRGLPLCKQSLRLLSRDRGLVGIGHGSAGAMRTPMFGAIRR